MYVPAVNVKSLQAAIIDCQVTSSVQGYCPITFMNIWCTYNEHADLDEVKARASGHELVGRPKDSLRRCSRRNRAVALGSSHIAREPEANFHSDGHDESLVIKGL